MRYQQSIELYRTEGEGLNGFFRIPTESGELRIMASEGKHLLAKGWEHVSISLETRTPTWDEMSRVKSLFWGPEECVIQFHPPESQYKRQHPYVLHIWKPPYETPTPPEILI